MNSTPAASKARRTANSLAAVSGTIFGNFSAADRIGAQRRFFGEIRCTPSQAGQRENELEILRPG
jgi:hypothetical protein